MPMGQSISGLLAQSERMTYAGLPQAHPPSPTDHPLHLCKSLLASDPVIGAVRFASARQGSHSGLHRQPHVNERFLGRCNRTPRRLTVEKAIVLWGRDRPAALLARILPSTWTHARSMSCEQDPARLGCVEAATAAIVRTRSENPASVILADMYSSPVSN
jgi:hypothetical protein